MAKASVSELFSAKAADIFDVINDFESYPDFLPEVESCKIIKKTKKYTDVEFTVEFIKKATYVIRVETEKNKRIWWSMVSGDLFKKNDGEWEIETVGKQCQVNYSLDLDFKIYVPGMILKKAVAVSLPAMVKNVKKRVSSL